jgi:hypothetical protein
VWINRSCERLNIIKQLEDGTVGNHVIQPRKCGLPLEITAYVFRNLAGEPLGLREVQQIMRAKGCALVWP